MVDGKFKEEIEQIINSVTLPEIYEGREDKEELIAHAQIDSIKNEIRKLALAPLLNSEKIYYLNCKIKDLIKEFPALSYVFCDQSESNNEE